MENNIIFGIRAVIEAIEAGKEIEKLFIKKDLQGELSHELFSILKGRDIPLQRVPLERLNRLTRKNHQGVVGFISQITYQRIEDIIPTLYEEGKQPFILLLDGLTDVRNFGAIARTAECAGVHAIIIPSRNSVSVGPDAIKTSAGALLSIPVCREPNLERTIKYLKNSGLHIVGATEKSNLDYTKGEYSGPVCLIMGAEDTGIPNEHLALAHEWVRIPILGQIQSLNVSVAAGILIYEILKSRTDAG